MTTALEKCTTEEQCYAVLFLWANGLGAKDIHKEMFPVTDGKCLSYKVVHNWVEKCGRCFTDEEAETEVQKRLRRQSKDIYAAGFNAVVK
jgi:hypothetical protein